MAKATKNKILNKSKKPKIGYGLINSIINKIPVELHLPGYQYCGPGTNLKKRLARGDPGINELDKLCKEHDIAYDQHKDGAERYKADKALASGAWKRVKSKDASFGERAAALSVVGAMKTKMGLSKLGAGLKEKKQRSKKDNKRNNKTCKKKKKTFNQLVKKTQSVVNQAKPNTIDEALLVAIKAAKHFKKQNTIVAPPRIIRIPKSGGVLPLVPILAGLSALGSLAGSVTGVLKRIGDIKRAKEMLQENQRHNREMETIAITKNKEGKGLYLTPYKKGYGLYLTPYNKAKNF